jgi:hypothetical protein
MPLNRYVGDPRINLGQQLGTAEATLSLRSAIRSGEVPIVNQVIATGSDRLDTLAGTLYGDARYWWVLAVASGIGWGLQVPPGTIINVINLEDLNTYVK